MSSGRNTTGDVSGRLYVCSSGEQHELGYVRFAVDVKSCNEHQRDIFPQNGTVSVVYYSLRGLTGNCTKFPLFSRACLAQCTGQINRVSQYMYMVHMWYVVLLTCGPMIPQHLPSFWSLSHSSLNSIEFPYSVARRYLCRQNNVQEFNKMLSGTSPFSLLRYYKFQWRVYY